MSKEKIIITVLILCILLLIIVSRRFKFIENEDIFLISSGTIISFIICMLIC